ncbi:cell wall hydrolase [Halobacillus salinarum]|uniref:Cell wall hydrolase n=1 Tax=Halobacillus salinarum TaxID=2932257 RepID=A0ABY4EJ59_9BACI|nr:cell wall hydrolase [Halobacillus salinarum]UOQ44513.1 cell wall hydrolase [Halobacillus salinarum]
MLKRFLIASLAIICSFTFSSQVNAASNQTHTVQKGESLYKVGKQYGISAQQLKAMNHLNKSMIYPGQTLKLPVMLNASEKNLLARLVEAEAKGESYAGKVAVATVVLNRVESDEFPDSLRGVVYDGTQFSPVLNGTIHQAASRESKRAVNEALGYQGYDRESLFFYNPGKASSDYLSSREVTTVIGNHVFMR